MANELELLQRINNATSRTKLRIAAIKEHLTNMLKDPQKKLRLQRQECVYCYYTSTIAGQGFTKYTCAHCSKEEWHHNTAVPKLCKECAVKFDACMHCMSDLELAGPRTYTEEV